jgi:hypothetical protein
MSYGIWDMGDFGDSLPLPFDPLLHVYVYRIHRPCDSLFSWSSGFNDFGGFVNWGFLLLLLGGSRLFLENVIKYGIRINPYEWFTVFVGGSVTFMPPSLILLVCKKYIENTNSYYTTDIM